MEIDWSDTTFRHYVSSYVDKNDLGFKNLIRSPSFNVNFYNVMIFSI